jgi:LDH2 family malate/lactate/ureidoglycolate dehydrogenase
MPLEEFKNRVNQLIDEIKGCKKLSETSEIFLPGEFEFRTEQKRREEGIPIYGENWKELENLASEFNINLTS